MRITEWRIWHTFSSYYLENITDLRLLGKGLLKHRFAHAIINSSGEAFYLRNGKIIVKNLNLTSVTGQSYGTVNLPKTSDNYLQYCLIQGSNMLFQEINVLSESYREKVDYIRCYLLPCYIQIKDNQHLLFPQLKIYENGIYILSFQLSPPEEEINLNQFIDSYVNLSQCRIDNMGIPPDIIKLAHKYVVFNELTGIFSKRKLHTALLNSNKEIDEHSVSIDSFGFSLKVCPYKYYFDQYDVDITLNSLKDIITISLTQVLDELVIMMFNPPFRHRNYQFSPGNYWRGRPIIYILSFEEQPSTSTDILLNFDEDIMRILARTSGDSLELERHGLPQNYRLFNDYTSHFNEALSLFIFSKKGLIVGPDLLNHNNERVLLDKEVFQEAIIFNQMTHMKYIERSTLSLESQSFFSSELLNISTLESLSIDISPYGELTKMYLEANSIFKIDDTRNRIEHNLRIRSEDLQQKRENLTRKFGWLITMFFGVIGSISLAEKIIGPFWKHYNLWMPKDKSIQSSFISLVTLVSILLIITISWFITERKFK